MLKIPSTNKCGFEYRNVLIGNLSCRIGPILTTRKEDTFKKQGLSFQNQIESLKKVHPLKVVIEVSNRPES